MKINAPLNLLGNELTNFIVHNGDTSSEGLPAKAGRLVYDPANTSLYFGYNKGSEGDVWSRLVDVAHLSQSMSDDAVYNWAKKVSESTVNVDENSYKLDYNTVVQLLQQASDAHTWGDHKERGYAKAMKLTIDDNIPSDLIFTGIPSSGYPKLGIGIDGKRKIAVVAVEAKNNIRYYTEWKAFSIGDESFPSSDEIRATSIITFDTNAIACKKAGEDMFAVVPIYANYFENLIRNGVDQWEFASRINAIPTIQSWGNHADEGYAKAFQAEIVEKYTEIQLHMSNGEPDTNNYYFAGVYFNNDVGLWAKFIAKGMESIPESQRDYKYFKTWSKGDTYLGSSDYNKDGVLVFVNGNVYKYESGKWNLYLAGASQDVITKIDAIKDALGLEGSDDKDSDPDKNFIDTWNEMKSFFANVTNEKTLMGELSKKANDVDVIKKPSFPISGDMLVIDGGGPVWKKRKIVASNINDDHFAGTYWEVDISELGTTDVNITLYIKNEETGRFDVVLADISTNEMDRAGSVRRTVYVEFGADMSDSELKLVVTA